MTLAMSTRCTPGRMLITSAVISSCPRAPVMLMRILHGQARTA